MKTFNLRSPILNILFIVSLTAVGLIRFFMPEEIIGDLTSNTLLYLLYIIGTWLLTCIVLYLIYRLYARLKPMNITIRENELEINGTRVIAGQIDEIRTEGYFMPVVGILVNGKKMVSPKHCFRFAGREDEAMKALKEWAEENQVIMRKKPFFRWL